MNSPVLLEVEHHTLYHYAAPVSLAHHLAHLRPMQDPHQALLAFELHIDPAPDEAGTQGPAADRQRFFCLTQPHRQLHVRAQSRVRVLPRFEGLQPEQSPAWDELASRLRYRAGSAFEPAVQFTYPSPYVPRLAALRSLAVPFFPPARPVVQGALALMEHIHQHYKYQTHSTRIDTPLAQVLKERRGVCQDFAHLMTGALRMLGLPARYVSGYLLTQPPEGGPAMVGADATHAWVQLWCPGTPGVPDLQVAPGVPNDHAQAVAAAGWLDLDPTNNRVPATGHVRLAVGRDFGDVTPLRGVIRGGGQHTLAVGVHTRVLTAAETTPAAQERRLL
jgi:transglutaminase-like putative cysteine protease